MDYDYKILPLDNPVRKLVEKFMMLPESQRSSFFSDLLIDKDPALRAFIPLVARFSHVDLSDDNVILLLNDDVWFVRLRACEYATEQSRAVTFQTMLVLVVNDDNEAVKAAAAVAIGELGTVSELPKIHDLIGKVYGFDLEGNSIEILVAHAIDRINCRHK